MILAAEQADYGVAYLIIAVAAILIFFGTGGNRR